MDNESMPGKGPDERRVRPGSEARSLVERLRLLEADHEPDGWPAVQLRDITALCSEIDRLGAELKTANANHERFERGWYLRGDALEKVKDAVCGGRAPQWWISQTCDAGLVA